MSEDLARFRELLQRLPFWLAVPLAVFLYYSSVLAYIAFLPFAFIYRMLLLPMVWIEWERQRKEALIIHSDSDYSRKWMQRLAPLIGDRAIILNWTDHKNWDRSTLPTQLFEMFGPRGIPEHFTAHSLPAVLLFRQLRRPERFLFGTHSQDPEKNFQHLCTALASR